MLNLFSQIQTGNIYIIICMFLLVALAVFVLATLSLLCVRAFFVVCYKENTAERKDKVSNIFDIFPDVEIHPKQIHVPIVQICQASHGPMIDVGSAEFMILDMAGVFGADGQPIIF